jgi:hypothetical protein
MRNYTEHNLYQKRFLWATSARREFSVVNENDYFPANIYGADTVGQQQQFQLVAAQKRSAE